MISSEVGEASFVGGTVGEMISIVEVGITCEVAGSDVDVDSTIGGFVVVQAVRRNRMTAMMFFIFFVCRCEEPRSGDEAISFYGENNT